MSEYMTFAQINAFRVSLGLKPIERGKITCLHCGHEFNSPDKQRRKICTPCHKSEREQGFHDTVYGNGGLHARIHYSMDLVKSPTAPST